MADFKSRALHLFRDRWSWSDCRGFAQSRVGAFVAFLPFLGFLILYNGQFQEFLSSVRPILAQDSEPSSFIDFETRINLIYLGLFLVGGATVIFKIIAPEVIKEYASDVEYIERKVETVTAVKLRKLFLEIDQFNHTEAQKLLNRAGWLSPETGSEQNAQNQLVGASDNSLAWDIFGIHYETMNWKPQRKALILIVYLYSIGFLLFSIPSVEFTIRVFISMF